MSSGIIYEEQCLVVEGRGSTEVWQEGRQEERVRMAEGLDVLDPAQRLSSHRQCSASPALLLAGTSAPNAMNLYANGEFIFNCPFVFRDRFDGGEDYFKAKDDIAPDPVRGLAMRRTNLIPDVINCELPLDNRRSPGYRRIEPHMAGNRFYLWIGQHETGRYSKAHEHGSAAVLICLSGKGYTYTWPSSLGPHPFSDGKRDKVVRIDYEPVGMVVGGADERRLVPPAFRHQQGAAAALRLVRPE